MPQIDGIHYASTENSKNYLINSNFDIWQRGISIADPAAFTGYTADRWAPFQTTGSVTISRQAAIGLTGSVACMRVLSNAANAFRGMAQALENFTTATLYGKYVTFSVYLRRNAAFNVPMVLSIEKNTTPNTTSGGTWTAINSVVIANASLDTSAWNRFSITSLIPADGTAQGLRLCVNVALGTTASGGYFEIAQAMLNTGKIPASFKTQGADLGEELLLCQRYFETNFDVDVTPAAGVASGRVLYKNHGAGATDTHANVMFKVPKRVIPSITTYQSTGAVGNTAVDNVGVNGGVFFNTLASGVSNFFHWTANAELL